MSYAAHAATSDQNQLQPDVIATDAVLRFDWPMIQIGIGQYPQGPTGVTVFRFGRKVAGAVDVRGGAPGTVNTDYLRLGYDSPELDAVVFAGGSWYGLEATTAVATALKDDGLRDGTGLLTASNIALAVGAIIYDLGDRRLNEIYPDKRLAQAAYRSTRPGVFPLGAQGAGRFAKTGGYFGCNAHSGQGGAFRQIGNLKIAAFTVVNAYGVVTARDGRVAACYAQANWPHDLRTSDLMQSVPDVRHGGGALKAPGEPRNTTVSLVVTNEQLPPAELQRLAVQVHTSMARAIQPFATQFDGDVLYAVSTGEIDNKAAGGLLTDDVGTIASEAMWDAVLSSVPAQQTAPEPPPAPITLTPKELQNYVGDYRFSPFVSIRISVAGAKLLAQASGERRAYSIARDRTVELVPVSADEFVVPGRYPLTLRFEKPLRLVLNPGQWQQVGARLPRANSQTPPKT